MKRLFLYALAVVILLSLLACTPQTEQNSKGRGGKMTVVTTLFPMYDFARRIGGEHATVRLLLPPGAEAHSFEPKPSDMAMVGSADIFIFTHRAMEPWSDRIVAATRSPSLLVVDASRGCRTIPVRTPHKHHGEHGELKGNGDHGKGEDHRGHEEHETEYGGVDPHLWLDFDNARLMVKNIADAFVAKDPSHADTYRANASRLDSDLAELDRRFRSGLSQCRTRTFVHGGHYAFGYLADRYGLHYRSAQAVSPDSDPTPREIASLLQMVKREKLSHVFAEEIVSPRIAELISRETGVSILYLHGGHNLTGDQLAQGTTFIQLMEKNLQSLRIGLGCP